MKLDANLLRTWENVPLILKKTGQKPRRKNQKITKKILSTLSGKIEDSNKEIPITQCLEVRGINTDKSNCLTTVAKDNVLTTMPIGRHPDAFKNNLLFRYYTIKEYCRLQTVPENYFYGVATENQIRKMIGNGWTVDVIAHIFGGLSQHYA